MMYQKFMNIDSDPNSLIADTTTAIKCRRLAVRRSVGTPTVSWRKRLRRCSSTILSANWNTFSNTDSSKFGFTTTLSADSLLKGTPEASSFNTFTRTNYITTGSLTFTIIGKTTAMYQRVEVQSIDCWCQSIVRISSQEGRKARPEAWQERKKGEKRRNRKKE